MPTLAKRQTGFTLIELLVVLTLMSAMSAFVAPKLWGQYVNFSERNAIEQWVNEIRKQVQQERLNNNHYTFVPSNVYLQAQAQRLALTIESAQSILFRHDGVSSGGTIVLKTERGRRWQVVVAPLDGGVKIERSIAQ